MNKNVCVIIHSKGVVDVPVLRFDKSLEEFYSICDQIELHLVRTYTFTILLVGSSIRLIIFRFRKLP